MASQSLISRQIVLLAVSGLVMQSALAAQPENRAKGTFDMFRSKVANMGTGQPLHAKIVEVLKVDPATRVFAGEVNLKSKSGARRIWMGFSKSSPDVFFIDGNPKDNTFITVFQADGSLQLRAAASGNGYDGLTPVATERVADQYRYVLDVSEQFLAGTLKKLSGQPRK